MIADTVPSAATRITHQRIDQDALGRSVAKAAITVGGPRAAAQAVRTALAGAARPGRRQHGRESADPDAQTPSD